MPAAMRPYSMAVAPDSFFRKREMNLFIGSSHLKFHPCPHLAFSASVRGRSEFTGRGFNGS
jgi:hypothetical protein